MAGLKPGDDPLDPHAVAAGRVAAFRERHPVLWAGYLLAFIVVVAFGAIVGSVLLIRAAWALVSWAATVGL